MARPSTEVIAGAVVLQWTAGAAEARTRANKKLRSGGYAACCAEDQSASEGSDGAMPGETRSVVYFYVCAPSAHCGTVISNDPWSILSALPTGITHRGAR
eukprot:6195681-Pleurochrysis_carterae.AAC.3